MAADRLERTTIENGFTVQRYDSGRVVLTSPERGTVFVLPANPPKESDDDRG